MGKLKNIFRIHHKKKESADTETPVAEGGATSRTGERAMPSSAAASSSHEAPLVNLQDDRDPLLSFQDETFTNDSEPTTPRTRLAKLLRLDAYRFGGALLFLALLFFLASMLHIALEPHFLKDTTFSLEHLGIFKPTNDSFMLHADVKLQIARIPFDLVIDKVSAEVWHKDKVAGILSLSGIDISGSERSELSMRTPFQITDLTAFETLLVSAIKEDVKNVKVRALVNVQSKRFPSLRYQLPFELPVEVPSPEKLPFKFSILATELKEAEGGLVVLVDVNIDSSSPLAITLPVVKFNMFYDGIKVGRIVSDEELKLKRGSNNASLTGYISNPSDDPSVARSIGSIVSAFVRGEPTVVLLEGDSSGLDMPVKWMRSALDAVSFPFEIAALTTMQKNPVRSAKLNKLAVSIKDKDILISYQSEIRLREGPSVNAKLISAAAKAKLELPSDGKGRNATLVSFDIPTQHFKEIGNASYSISGSFKVPVLPSNQAAIKDLLSRFTSGEDSLSVVASGFYSLKMRANGVLTNIQQQPFERRLSLPPLRRLLSRNLKPISGVQIVSAQKTDTTFKADIPFELPISDLSVSVGSLSFFVLHNGNEIGRADVNTSKPIGTSTGNKLPVLIRIQKDKARELMSAYINGKSTLLTLRGNPEAAGINQLLRPFLSVTIPDIVLAGKPLPLLHAISLVSTAKNIWPQAYVTVSNPFSVPIQITSIRNLRVEHDSEYLTTINEDPIDPPFAIPPSQTSTPDRAFAASYKGDLKSGLVLLPELLKHKHVPVSLNGIVGVQIGNGFAIELPYEQSGVPLSYTLKLH